MSNMTTINPIESALIQNNLAQLNPEQRLNYYNQVCESLGLNPLTQPFGYITLNGKLTLYAKRDATDQLRAKHKISINIEARESVGDIYIVTARARNEEGRLDESIGAVNVSGLKGDALANAMMKAETKAKRRVTLSICGLGFLDESEVHSITEWPPIDPPPIQNPQSQPKPTGEKIERVKLRQEAETNIYSYVPKAGKFSGKRLSQCDVGDLSFYIIQIDEHIKKTGMKLKGSGLEDYNAIKAFIETTCETSEPEEN